MSVGTARAVRGIPSGSATLRVSGDELLDSSTLERLCGLADRFERSGRRLVVLCDDEPVRRLLHIAGFTRRFDLPRTRDLAA